MPNTLFISLARGGSKGVPRKNLRTVAGVPLVGRAARLGCRCLDRLGGAGRVVVSTDDEEIAATARQYGAETPFLRPEDLAGDKSLSAPAVLHAIDWFAARGEAFDTVVLLQPTTPLTSVEDVLGSLALFHQCDGEPVVAVTDADDPVAFRFHMDDTRLTPVAELPFFPERHDRRPEMRLATSIYICTPDWLKTHDHWLVPGRTHGFRVPPKRAVEIDEEMGFVTNEALHQRQLPWGHGKVLIIAEAGVNHNGDMNMALEMIDLAAEAGADAVKFQTFKAANYISRYAPQAEYQKQNTGSDQSMLALMEALELTVKDFERLSERCQARDVLFASSVFDEDAPDILDALDVPFFKMPSGEVPNLRLLEKVARKYRPIILSTGMSNLAEVAMAVDVIRGAGNRDLALLQCTSDYPSQAVDANLRAMQTMAQALNIVVGYSDHTIGHEVACAAVALGAQILEKHFTLDKNLPGPDHAASANPEELIRYVRAVRNVEAALGSAEKTPTEADLITATVARKSLVAARDLPSGYRLADDDILVKRPGTGISPALFEQIVGRTLTKDMAADELFEWESFV